jgi:hypothetical protein
MIEYQRDDLRRRIVWTLSGEVTLAEILEATNRQAAEGVWAYPLLYDARLRLGTLTRDEIREFVACVAAHMAKQGPRGRVAILVQPDASGMAQMFSFIGQLVDGENRVFRSLTDAERWLNEPRQTER